MRSACTCYDTCVNNKIMCDLVELEMACNISVQDSPRWPSGPGRGCWTQAVTSWYDSLAGTGLLISARRNSVLCEATPLLCCRAGAASAQGVLPTFCIKQWLLCPFHHLLQIPVEWRRPSRLLGHAVHRRGASLACVYSRWLSTGETGWLGCLGWRPLHQKMPVQTGLPRNLLHWCPIWLSLHECLFSWTTLLLWEVAGVASPWRCYIPLSVGLQWYRAVCYGGWMGILQWGRTVRVQLWTIVHKHSLRQELVVTNRTMSAKYYVYYLLPVPEHVTTSVWNACTYVHALWAYAWRIYALPRNMVSWHAAS